MNSKLKIALIVILTAAITIGVTAAATSYFFQTNDNKAEYSGTPELEIKLNGLVLTGTDAIDWGKIQPSTGYSKTLSVKNIGNVDVNVTLTTAYLPAGFEMLWAGNKTILTKGDTLVYALSLNTPATLTPQTFTWTTTIKGEP